MNGHPFTLHVGARSGSMDIAGTAVSVQRTADNRYAATAVGVVPSAGSDWIEQAGLTGRTFARRCDLLAVMAAEHAARPMPGPDPVAGQPCRLTRQTDGSHLSDCGHFIVRPAEPGAADRRWTVHEILGPGRTRRLSSVPTLRRAAQFITTKRYVSPYRYAPADRPA